MQPEFQTDGSEATIDLREYWNVILKRRWTVALFFLVVVTLVTIFTLRQTKIYEARAKVIIEPYAPQVLGNVNEVYNLGTSSYWSDQQYYNTQIDVITSRTVAQRVVQLLRLEGNREFLGIDNLSEEEQQNYLEEPPDYAEIVQGMLNVELGKDSQTALINARHQNPLWAQRIANATVNAYIDFNRQKRQQITQDSAAWLSGQSAAIKEQMSAAQDKLQEFKRENQMLSESLENRQNITSQKLFDLNQTLSRIQAERIALESKRKQILEYKKAGMPPDSVDKVIDNNLIQNLKGDYIKLDEEKAGLLIKYKPEHPKFKAVEEKLQMYRKRIEQEINNVLASMESEYQAKLENERALKKELDKVKNEAQDISEKEVKYNQIKQIADNYTAAYAGVLKRQTEATLASRQETNNIYKLDSAIEPKLPVYPRIKLNILLAALIGLLGGIGLAFFLEYLDNTIKTQEDIERYLKIAFLGIIPSIKLDSDPMAGEMITSRDHYLIKYPKSSVAEQCRTIRTNIMFMSPEKPTRRVLVTSASPQEGKSTVVVNLGVTMAQSGSKILLLDTDMRRPRLHKTFEIKSGLGLTTLILGEAEIDQVIVPTEVPGLDVMPCGPIPPNPTELFHTERFNQLVEELSQKYDRLIFDSPPLLMVADPLILSRLMDGVLLVVKGAHTSREIIGRALRQLQDVNARILGAIVNDLDLSHRQYGYYYYRQYGYYYGEKERDVTSQ